MRKMSDQPKVQLTQNAVDRLREELGHLEGEGREKVIGEIATARAHGDLSENAEYHAAKDQQGLQEARVRQIKQMLENAEIIEADDDDPTIKPGKIVTIRYEGDEEPETYLIGVREEKGGDYPILTPESPVGQVLIGHGQGDNVTAKLRDADVRIEVLEVRSS
jgi:transcription elongation factor GreA